MLLRYAWGMDTASQRTTTTRSRGAAYVAAWRHVRELFAAQGVRAFWVWSPNADAFAGARGGVDQYWPGDDYVDWVAADGFNWGSCTNRSTWRDFGPIFKAFSSWGSARAKPLMISGTGTVEDSIDPGRKRGWVSFSTEVENQDGEAVLKGRWFVVLQRRPQKAVAEARP